MGPSAARCRELSTASGPTSTAAAADVIAQCAAVRRPYLASRTVTACAASTSSDSSFR